MQRDDAKRSGEHGTSGSSPVASDFFLEDDGYVRAAAIGSINWPCRGAGGNR